jgi:L-fucose mutarotase/ribose pyranase (RbsD/FucU family)
MNANWAEILKNRLELYGHRNWLVVADSAYPAQSKPGIEIIVADADQITVLDRVQTILRTCKHVTATVYTDRELTFVREEDAPGVTSYREKLSALFNSCEAHAVSHDTIIGKLDEVAEKFRVLLIKSNMRIPYTSVFLELGCGYWSAEAEERLRAAIRSVDRRLNGSKRSDGNSSRVSRSKVQR